MTKDRVAFAMSLCQAIEKLIGVALRGPPSRAYNLRRVTIIIRKWLPNMVKLSGALDSAHSREDTNILLAQIILRSDYSGSVKELW